MLALFSPAPRAFAQTDVLLAPKPLPVTAKAGSTFEVHLPFELRPGFHVQSHTPSDKYYVPLKLTWSTSSFSVADIIYPKPAMEKYSFDEKPLSVVSGRFELVTKLTAPAGIPAGPTMLRGKLHYQACNDRECKSPKDFDIAVPVVIVK